jgi:flagellar hook-length control protein FliK
MTMPDTIALPRAPAMTEAAAAPRPAAAPAAAGGEGFAQTLANVMEPAEDGAESGKTAEIPSREAPPVDGKADAEAVVAKAAVVLDDLGRIAALLPMAVGAEGVAEAPAAEPPAAAAVQAVLAGVLPKAVVAPEGSGDTEPDGELAEGETEETDPLAALGLGPAAQVATVALPVEGEGEAAVGQAVATVMAQGAMQPMMAAQVKPAVPPAPPLGEVKAESGEVTEAEGTDAPTEAREAVQRREAAGLTPVAVQAVDRQAARAAVEAVADTVVETVAAPPAPTGQTPQQAVQVTAQVPAAAGFVAPAPIATDRPGWEGALADRIAAELSGDGQQMDLELAPEHLGRLRIRLEMTDGQAQVRFVTETPEAARVIQQNEHRLSESLSRAGLSLGGQETASRDPQGDQRPARSEGVAARFLERPVEGLAAAIPGRAARGLVNLIA